MRSALLFAVLFSATTHSAGAQLRDIFPGARVRMRMPSSRATIDGTIAARAGDSIVVATQKGAQYRAAMSSLTSLDLYRGRSSIEGAKKGALWGAAIGALPLIIAYAAAQPSQDRWSRTDQLHFSLFVLGVYAETGALIGLGVRADRWERCRSATAPTCGSRP